MPNSLQIHAQQRGQSNDQSAVSKGAVWSLSLEGELVNVLSGERFAWDPLEAGALNPKENSEKLKALAKSLEVIWVPTEVVRMQRLYIPGKRSADCQKALPFTLEAQLSLPIEDYFIAIFDRKKATSEAGGYIFTVALVTHQQMQQWLKALESFNLSHLPLIPDCFRLPEGQSKLCHSGEQSVSRMAAPEKCWIRLDETYGLVTTETWMDSVIASIEKQLGSLRVSDKNSNQQENSEESNYQEFHSVQAAHLLTSELEGLTESQKWQLKKLDLRQDIYSAKPQSAVWQKGLLFSVGLMLTLVILLMVKVQWQTSQIQQQATVYQQQTEKLFQQMFPDSKRIVNIKAQTISRLKNQASNSEDTDLIHWLSSVESLIAAVPEIKVTNLDWSNPKQLLKLQLHAKSGLAVQKLNELASQRFPALKIEVATKSVKPELVEAELYVRKP